MSPYYDFDEQRFRVSVDDALKNVERILHIQRNPRLAEDVDHKYDDKYDLANRMTNMAIIAQMNCLNRLGLTPKVIQEINTSKTTTLRFDASEKCIFLKKQLVKKESDLSTEQTKETNTTFGNKKKTTINKIIKKVEEFHWQVDTHWEISIFAGTDEDKKTVLETRESSTVIATQSDRPPLKEEFIQHPPKHLNLTWLLQQIDINKVAASFTIDTEKAKTPRRNEQVEDALQFFTNMNRWTHDVQQHFTSFLQNNVIDKNKPVAVEPKTPNQNISVHCSTEELFIPIIPLMEEISEISKSVSSDQSLDDFPTKPKSTFSLSTTENPKFESVVLSNEDCTKMLNEQVRSINDKVQIIEKSFASAHTSELFSITEGILVILCNHSGQLSFRYQQTMRYIEKMIEDQLVKAIGKRVSTSDLDKFMRYHNPKFLTIPPKPFCHAIGRPNHYPFGILSIESNDANDSSKEPIETLIREVDSPITLKVPLTAATTLELTGKVYLHGWMNHCGGGFSNRKYDLVAQARQFSSFLLVVGTMMGPDRLNPKEAIILQNKDEVIIPLLLNELPSAKEFKDAIQSLSPEQQRFAKAFRSMQLESSVFGVCVIQIKPQLEALLGLPEDSLAKEIKLTEDLMDLFVEYQVPSDLLSYDGDVGTGVSVRDKVENVRKHVQGVLDVIKGIKEKQVEDSAMKADVAFNDIAVEFFECSGLKPSGDLTPVDYKKENALSSAGFMDACDLQSSICARGGVPSLLDVCSSVPTPTSVFLSKRSSTFETGDQDHDIISMEESHDNDETKTSNIDHVKSGDNNTLSVSVLDFTSLPKVLDASIEKYDKDSALRSTTIKTGDNWSRCRQTNLLTKSVKATLDSSAIKSEKNKAFDLLDALSRSGSLPIVYSDLHVVLCVTHRFEKDVMNTIIQDNINPIERLELSTLLLGSTVHGTTTLKELVVGEKDKDRLGLSFPLLLEG